MKDKVPTIIDNQNGNTLLDGIIRLLPSTESLDIATGTFEIGSFLALDRLWQELAKIRIIMGHETSKRTKRELTREIADITDKNIESVKEKDDTLTGLPSFREALEKGKILPRIYSKSKFHAKALLFNTKEISPVDYAIVGSSNFTAPGLEQNTELNLFSSDQIHVEELRKWYEKIWDESETIKADLLNVIERHLKEHPPFTIYAKALYEYFTGREKSQDEWERNESIIYPMLSEYQKSGYHTALKMAEDWGGALICDGVGLGKTFIGLMLIENLLRSGKRILLIVPKSALESVWNANIRRYLETKYELELDEWLRKLKHTDFSRPGTISNKKLQLFRGHYDAIIIDEAHHFRHSHTNRSKALFEICGGKKKQLYFLTATPINNSLLDLYTLINYFAQDNPKHFASIGVNNLRRLFTVPELVFIEASKENEWKALEEIDKFLTGKELFKKILIQRSRSYVMESERNRANKPIFPERQRPRVCHYSLRKVYDRLFNDLEETFKNKEKQLKLSIYNTEAFKNADVDEEKARYQAQVIGLIRTLFLKRLESSFKALEASIENLLYKMAKFIQNHDEALFEEWANKNRRWWKLAQDHIRERLLAEEESDDEEENDIPGTGEQILDPDEFQLDPILNDTLSDMEKLTSLLSKIYNRFYLKESEGVEEDYTKDDKLITLVKLLTDEPVNGEPDLRGQKVVVFTEFKETARHLRKSMETFLKDIHIEQIDSSRKIDREKVIKRFAPYYNCDENELKGYLKEPIDILISTDVLSEGLNLQDASLIINYDLHWNPVRLMQRIGRIDRRMNSNIERRIKRPRHLKRRIFYWNFLPPDDLERLLKLHSRLTGKIRRINAALGIEGSLLHPDDPEMTLKEFNQKYEGDKSSQEKLKLELERIEREYPELYQSLPSLPKRLYSGKGEDGEFPKGLFCAYRLPRLEHIQADIFNETDGERSSDADSGDDVVWYYIDLNTGNTFDDLEKINEHIKCTIDTPRYAVLSKEAKAEARKKIERLVRKQCQRRGAAALDKPTLLCWMEVC